MLRTARPAVQLLCKSTRMLSRSVIFTLVHGVHPVLTVRRGLRICPLICASMSAILRKPPKASSRPCTTPPCRLGSTPTCTPSPSAACSSCRLSWLYSLARHGRLNARARRSRISVSFSKRSVRVVDRVLWVCPLCIIFTAFANSQSSSP